MPIIKILMLDFLRTSQWSVQKGGEDQRWASATLACRLAYHCLPLTQWLYLEPNSRSHASYAASSLLATEGRTATKACCKSVKLSLRTCAVAAIPLKFGHLIKSQQENSAAPACAS